ncbi:eukaryotic translation initiation factor 3 subunit B [Hyaloscypha bicolor E]|uniref:Eukaryotic translation initiation factor 3 subunit B n=1 Tax=Hyaloscypha bicolor E TaxID=1095630 RepID=A0A2J6TGM6_9HELO|nr:eukaryotic translation initiation factor 3 subunit B [Hyaloscypha bicolor E]PMD62192.1 eukaryotic translation initiation factor 3 subunit B [Hyaloscypha bicolor E]
MAPSFDHLPDPEDEDYDEDEELDFSDLRERFEVQLEQGLDAFVVIDGLPSVTEETKPKLIKFLKRKLDPVGKVKEDSIFMPLGPDGTSEKFAFVEFSSAAEALAACKQLDMVPLDKRHTLRVNKMTDIERFGREGRIDENYTAPAIPAFEEKEHLRSWLADPSGRGRDQFVMYKDDRVQIFWNNEKDAPEPIVDRQHWTETFVQWSPQGTYLTSMHAQGVQLWGGPSWTRQKRFAHPFVNLVDFSPGEKYLTTWSHRPIVIPEEGHPMLSVDDDGKNYVIWDIETGKPLRSFANLDLPSNTTDEAGQPVKRKIVWPAFKWSADDKYVARLTQGASISVYELPRMGLLDKTSIKIEGVMDFDWAPATPHREGIKTYEQLFCYWTPEIGSNPAKVGLMSVPSKEVVRTLNLFSVTDAKLHWQSNADYLCVKVDRHSKSKKSLATSLEIFRVREKGVPVEVVDSIKDTVINFAWEPKGDRFVIITTAEVVAPTAVPPKTSVSFYCPEKVKGAGVGNFKHIRTYDKKNSNAIYWSPKGRFVIVATVHSQQSFDMEFFDMDFEGEKPESDKDLTANLQLMNTADHYGVTDIDWDPTGRFVATSASIWKHAMENGYHLYDFKGEQLREEPVEKFKQWLWRPRPPPLLTKEEQKQIRKNLREYSKVFDQEDADRGASADLAVVEHRRRLLDEWLAWRAQIEEEVATEREARGLPLDPIEGLVKKTDEEEDQVIEEIVEEIVEETEEIIG